MAGVRISDLQEATSLLSTDQFVLARGTGNRRISGNTLLSLVDTVNVRVNSLSAFCDAKFVQKAGDTMTGFLTLHANPQNNAHAATKQYVDSFAIPSGVVLPFATLTVPTGWLICNGDLIPNGTGIVQGQSANFSALYSLIGSSFGSLGKLPDLRGVFIRGHGTGSFGSATGNIGRYQGDAFASHTHTGATGTESAVHTHGLGAGQNTFMGAGPQGLNAQVVVAGNATSYKYNLPATDAQSALHIHAFTTNATGDVETRPRNISLQYCIKY